MSLFNYQFISINKKRESYKIAYIDLNIHNSDEVILCLHGIVRNCRDFDYLSKFLIHNNKYRVLLVDVVGRGKSDWLIHKEDYVYNTYISDILHLLHVLNIDKISIIGTSMGGIIAMYLAYNFPNLIKKIVLNDIGPYIKYDALANLADRLIVYPSFKDLESARIFIKKYFSSVGITADEHIDHILKHQFIFSENTGIYSFVYDEYIVKNFSETLKEVSGKDFVAWDVWDKISVPMLLIRGEKSVILTKDTVSRMLQDKNNLDFIEFPNVGHAPSLFDIEHIVSVNNWLKKKID